MRLGQIRRSYTYVKGDMELYVERKKIALDEKRSLSSLLAECQTYEPVGSRVTCRPAPTDTDRDILCLVENAENFLSQAGYVGFTAQRDEMTEGYANEQGAANVRFYSRRRGEVNLIVTDSETFFHRFMVATRLALRFNLLSKEDRVALFQGVLYHRG